MPWDMDLADQRRAHFLEWLEASDFNAKSLAEHVGIPYTTLHSYTKRNSVTRSLKGETEAQIARALGLSIEELFGNPVSSNHVRAWRESLFIMEDELADRMQADVAYIRGIETGEVPLSPKVRRRLAEALGVPEGRLSHHPDDIDQQAAEIFTGISEADKPRAIEMLKVFKRTGTDG